MITCIKQFLLFRDQLDESKFTFKNNVQEAISSKNDEINQLKSTITELRHQLDKAQYEKNSYSKTNTIKC